MKKTILILVTVIFSTLGLKAQDMTIDQVLETYFETLGQEKLSAVTSITMTGKQMAQGMEFPFKVTIKRPNKLRLEATVQGNTMVQAFDGEKGWMIAPWLGTSDPQDVGEDQIKGFKEQADIDGKLFNWKEKGYTVELIGKEDMEGTEVYKIKLTEKPEKEGEAGDVTFYFVDAENFVVLKTTAKRILRGTEVSSDSYSSNYKEVEGIIFPFSIETKMDGNSVSQIVIEEVKFNEDIDDTIFSRPEKNDESKSE
ncbi:MAG: outer membrane lipoprotein-sorting protein [Bacteroidales bacterium]|nr:outer membrane lipoprotein-sorting protein [Bacteroidales bacterium]MBN2758099.1 outer membrane lipoprotein-sorting protein [Bacteroidales bacterium]